MKAINLLWIIPVCLFLGGLAGFILTANYIDAKINEFPAAACMLLTKEAVNGGLVAYLTRESQVDYIQRRCAENYIDFNATLKIEED